MSELKDTMTAAIITTTSTKTTTTFEIRREQLVEILVAHGLMPASARVKSIAVHNDDPWKSEGPRSGEPSDAVRITATWCDEEGEGAPDCSECGGDRWIQWREEDGSPNGTLCPSCAY
jgi:hypothetical protein